MKKELDYFYIGNSYGGNQDKFGDSWMRRGGCAAVTACDSSIYFSLYKNRQLYPYNDKKITQEDYTKFSKIMKPYLRPRITGIDKLSIYTEGFGKYLQRSGDDQLKMTPWEGERDIAETKEIVKSQIAAGYPIPCLTLRHANPHYDDYVWHWFLFNGYEEFEDTLMVKVVTYGSWHWLSLDELWNTGYERKGGLILFHE